MKKLIITSVATLLCTVAACGNGSLLETDPNTSAIPPSGKLFAQVELKTKQNLEESFFGGKDSINNIEDVYEINITQASVIVGELSFNKTLNSSSASFNSMKHAGEDHSTDDVSEDTADDHSESESTEPCIYENSLTGFAYINLMHSEHLPCVTIDEGTYSGISFNIHKLETDDEVTNLPADITDSILITGTATKDGIEYPFSVNSDVNQEIVIHNDSSLLLDSVARHLKVYIDLKVWFHGVDFEQLEMTDGIVLFDENHNIHRYEHMIFDHLPESISVDIEN